jgi:DNA-directed RNA polymerase omega subunit
MGYVPLDMMEELTANRYEQVLIAAQRARQLNAIRLAKLEMLSSENAEKIDIDGRKVTYVAVLDCMEGKVEFKRSND